MATTKAAAAQPPAANAESPTEWSAERLDALEERVTRLEEVNSAMLTGKVAEISQADKDRETLSRRPNSYAEAVEYEAARKRQEERDKAAEDAPEGGK